ncbi:hypothetical protein N8553_04485, partial [bacterium]|nr:hypothetical protein [bacterium]
NQLAFIEFLRHIVDGVISPAEAVQAYHSVLEKLSIQPHRPLEEDLQLTESVMSYGGEQPSQEKQVASIPPSVKVDFSKMSSEDRLAYHRERMKNL